MILFDDNGVPDKPRHGSWRREAQRLHRALRGLAALKSCGPKQRELIRAVLEGASWWDVRHTDEDAMLVGHCAKCGAPRLPPTAPR